MLQLLKLGCLRIHFSFLDYCAGVPACLPSRFMELDQCHVLMLFVDLSFFCQGAGCRSRAAIHGSLDCKSRSRRLEKCLLPSDHFYAQRFQVVSIGGSHIAVCTSFANIADLIEFKGPS
jgi:hypothetical protein